MIDVTNVNARAGFHLHTSVAAMCWRDAQLVRRHAELLGALASEHRLPGWHAYATVLLGWAAQELRQPEQAGADSEKGLAKMEVFGQRFLMPFFFSAPGLLFLGSGRAEEARLRVQRAIVECDKTDGRWCEAEAWRVRGELFLHNSGRDPAEAARSFERSLSIARSQGARVWELRTAVSLARLWADRGQRAEAREMLAPVYAWFTEGFDMADLKDAKALLDQLA
jgi:predicted ATPase